ncbi:hypothetical protein DICPUDRAFT_55714 [Dictyostelium purpureum]|uniref:Sucraseferredoxin-like family protein n=1 Tax=Dictyostelium purpureum TaxID=5786 RepID=F0ZNA5_DICPU|nr:uncharacterized protein DICPUDRAFT_55714 [Dictyostelium purpureum]EGC34571.1 hypothetical protein DICPUDRAFT_55714 [Dictyostelium purpureum]|eukprot:XP_003288895.1 hypothetical protein DICPUDRAFT_55714 [Dictyostelium purpureum]
MKSENIKILTIAASLGLSVAVTAFLFRYYSGQNNLSSFDTKESTTTTTSTTNAPTTTTSTTSSAPSTTTVAEKKPIIIDIEEMNAKCGFCRPEMTDVNRKSPNNSIHTYSRHFFMCTGIPSEEWPSKLYTATPYLEQFAAVFKNNGENPKSPFVINGTDIAPTQKDTLDIIIFPEMVKLVNITPEQMEQVLKYFLDHDTIDSDFPSSVQLESIKGKYIFVCTHKQKDERCGYCGPILVDQLKEEIKNKGLENDIQVFGTSHVGGHKYAGNLLIFPPGNWYGYVTPQDVSAMVDSAISGEVVQRLSRGTMGLNYDKN